MAQLRPFRALRPQPEFVTTVASPPYDVVSIEEARALAYGHPHSFLHVVRPEINLAPSIDEHAEAVYDEGSAQLQRLSRSVFMQEASPSLFVYRLTMDGAAQTGVFGCVSVAEYDADAILKHENTRPDKEDDRTRHILAQQAHAEPVMLTYRSHPAIDAEVAAVCATEPLYDFIAGDGVRHTLWKAGATDRLVDAFAGVEKLYIADGHHRCKAASRAAEVLRTDASGPDAGFEFFPAVLFPMDQMLILPYNRIVRHLPDGPAAFLDRLQQRVALTPDAAPKPGRAGDVALFLSGTWYGLTLPETNRSTVVDSLDVARLNEFLLEPLLGITDPRTDSNLAFVGGIRGTQELERLVTEGSADLAVSMYPTPIQKLVEVSDAGLLMPPKSTWFEPKLRSGLLVHTF